MPDHVLILEKDDSLRGDLALAFAAQRCEIAAAGDIEAALRRGASLPPDLLVIGRRTLERGGAELLSRASRALPGASLLLAGEDEGLAAEALRCGISDALAVPCEPAAVRLALARGVERSRLKRRNRLLERDACRLADDLPIVASSPRSIELLEAMERAAECAMPVLLRGETGSELEILARAIHAQSARRNHPFVAIDCRARPAERLRGELFGDVQANASRDPLPAPALLLEAAGGSLFLDEVADLPGELQAPLRQVLREKQLRSIQGSKPCPVDVRVLAASSLDTTAEADAGRFDRGLLELLSEIRLEVPPLRERRQDIPLLVDHFLARACERHRRPLLEVSGEAIERLLAHSWPGNVHELEITVEQVAISTRGDRVSSRDLPEGLLSNPVHSPRTGAPAPFCLKSARKALEADLIRQALRATHGNRTRASKLLNISHRSLLYKIREHAIRDRTRD